VADVLEKHIHTCMTSAPFLRSHSVILFSALENQYKNSSETIIMMLCGYDDDVYARVESVFSESKVKINALLTRRKTN
jgi:hypothetical protein